MQKVNEDQQDQVNVGTEHHGVPSSETKPSPMLSAIAAMGNAIREIEWLHSQSSS